MKDLTDSINVAVIGAGYWGKKVICEYLRLARVNPGANVHMVCDPLDETLVHCVKSYGIPSKNLTKDYRKVLKSRDVDAIHICTPNETHYQICREALEAGKHVLLEKPMTLNSKCAYELVDMAESRDLALQVGYIFRFNNALNKVRKLIKEGYFGDIYYLTLQWTTLLQPSPESDIITDLAPHPIDILNYLLDQWPMKVSCKGGTYRRNRLEEVAYVTTEFDGDRMANIELSWLQPGKVRQTSIIASERCVTVDCLNQIIRVYENKKDRVRDLRVQKNNTILTEISHFIKHVLWNEKSINSGPIGARNVEVLECLRRALQEEKTIRLPPVRYR